MTVARRFQLGVWVTLVSGTLAGLQGCILDGDASLGSDGDPTGGSSAGKSESGGSSTMSSGGKTSPGGSSASSGSASGGKSAIGGKSAVGGNPTSEAGAPTAAAGESASGGAPTSGGICALPIEVGPCDAAIPSFAFSPTGKCESFVYGGCEGNANRFSTQADCQAACENLECPSHLQTDTVYEVLPLNRPEKACVDLARKLVVSCSMLLNPSETVPTNYGSEFCVKRDNQLYYAGTTLPKANGWADCSPQEAEIVAQAPSCADL